MGYFSRYIDVEFPWEKERAKNLYAVQLASLKYPVDISLFEGMDNVVELKDRNGMYRYCVKPFSGKEEAHKICEKLKKNGYPEGRVVSLNSDFDAKVIADATSGIVKPDCDRDSSNQPDSTLANTRGDNNGNFSFNNTSESDVSDNKKVTSGLNVPGDNKELFFSVLLVQSESRIDSSFYRGVEDVKELCDATGQYCYLYGNYDTREDAHSSITKEMKSRFKNVGVVMVNSDKVVIPVLMNTDIGRHSNAVTSKKRRRGRQYVDYYYEDPELQQTPSLRKFGIEVGPFDNESEALVQMQRLQQLGFASARLIEKDYPARSKIRRKKKTAKNLTQKKGGTPRYTIQILASRVAKDPSSLKLKGVDRKLSQSDHLYRYYYGTYDNYWVCRRELREVRYHGYRDAFIVKMN